MISGEKEHIQSSASTLVLVESNNMVQKLFKFVRGISVEPLLLSSLFTIVMYSIVSQQFIYQQISEKYGLTNSNISKESTCKTTGSNISDSTKIILDKVSAETSSWVLYLNIAGFVPSFFCSIVIGTWGDVAGRKPALLLGFTGILGMIVVYIIVVQNKLNVAFLLIARILCGLCGDFNSILATCYAYISDKSTHKNRTFKIAIGEASTGIGGFLASILSGIFITAQGFMLPLWILFSFLLSSIFYIIFFLDESNTSSSQLKKKDKLRSLCGCKHYVNLWNFLSEDWYRTLKLLAISFCFFLQLTIHSGIGDVAIVYELSFPLCWSSLLIGFGSALRNSSYLFGVAIFKGLSKKLSDFTFILISSLSSTGAYITFAFASLTWIMFLGYTISIFRTISATVLRSMLSRLTGSNHQGVGFAIIACAESVAALVASSLFNTVYSATVDQYRGWVFLMGAGLQILFLGFAWLVSLKIKNDLVVAGATEHRRLTSSTSNESSLSDD